MKSSDTRLVWIKKTMMMSDLFGRVGTAFYGCKYLRLCLKMLLQAGGYILACNSISLIIVKV